MNQYGFFDNVNNIPFYTSQDMANVLNSLCGEGYRGLNVNISGGSVFVDKGAVLVQGRYLITEPFTTTWIDNSYLCAVPDIDQKRVTMGIFITPPSNSLAIGRVEGSTFKYLAHEFGSTSGWSGNAETILTAGDGINIVGNTISCTGGGGGGDVTKAYVDAQDNNLRNYAHNAYNWANDAYNWANLVGDIADNAYEQANSAYNWANDAYNVANNAYEHANVGYNWANSAYNTVNNVYNTLNTAYNTLNNVYDTSNTIYNLVNNLSNDLNNIDTDTINNAYNTANSAYNQANNAYNTTNNLNNHFVFLTPVSKVYLNNAQAGLALVSSGSQTQGGWSARYLSGTSYDSTNTLSNVFNGISNDFNNVANDLNNYTLLNDFNNLNNHFSFVAAGSKVNFNNSMGGLVLQDMGGSWGAAYTNGCFYNSTKTTQQIVTGFESNFNNYANDLANLNNAANIKFTPSGNMPTTMTNLQNAVEQAFLSGYNVKNDVGNSILAKNGNYNVTDNWSTVINQINTFSNMVYGLDTEDFFRFRRDDSTKSIPCFVNPKHIDIATLNLINMFRDLDMTAVSTNEINAMFDYIGNYNDTSPMMGTVGAELSNAFNNCKLPVNVKIDKFNSYKNEIVLVDAFSRSTITGIDVKAPCVLARHAFEYCNSLQYANLNGNYDTYSTTQFNDTFYMCPNLKEIRIDNLAMSYVNISNLFQGPGNGSYAPIPNVFINGGAAYATNVCTYRVASNLIIDPVLSWGIGNWNFRNFFGSPYETAYTNDIPNYISYFSNSEHNMNIYYNESYSYTSEFGNIFGNKNLSNVYSNVIYSSTVTSGTVTLAGNDYTYGRVTSIKLNYPGVVSGITLYSKS